ncbi:MFS general substrate transporter [Sistotremastrum suecicum HHB10207 ss-3]|uniref:MFS general substrate transporter n=1 Tax=Sistotremastrum suecicum HHB10207 ss-3 TaxID=1314776 RepID=A0A166HMQ3_9AGAM|nr:MFS general substrate transporter [Sistotremastrum suecicum HHB10207 ss-3]
MSQSPRPPPLSTTQPEAPVPFPSESLSPVKYQVPLPPPDPFPSLIRSNGSNDSKGKGPGMAEIKVKKGPKRMTTGDLLTLSISMAGAQIAWTVELGYGTPYLLALGVPDSLTSLVWLAGPLSGLIAQPLIGAISDASHSKYRRRSWVIASTVVLVLAGLTLAYSTSISSFFIRLSGDKTPYELTHPKVKRAAIPMAITAFYFLDFALNGIQASLRNLLLDVTAQEQLSVANAWHGRMINAGNIIGSAFGFWNLGNLPLLRLLGGDQFRKLCIVALVILVSTVLITVTCHEEPPKEVDLSGGPRSGGYRAVINNITNAIRHLPRPIRRVCYVQVFSWMAWFPFLFYSTAYVGQVMAKEIDRDPDVDDATRAGEFAMFLYGIVAVLAGSLIPWLAGRDRRLLAHDAADDEDEDAEFVRIREMVRSWKSEAAREGRPLKLPTMPFMLRNIWTAALVLFAIIMFSTFFITTVFWATVAVALLGVCWAITVWVPFAILMEYLKEVDTHNTKRLIGATGITSGPSRPPPHQRAISTPAIRPGTSQDADERSALLRRHSLKGLHEGSPDDDLSKSKPLAGGTVLGIHNLAIVFPQLLVSIIASVIFKLANPNDPENPTVYYGKDGVGWVMRFGGICAIVAALISRMVPPTKTEKEMRKRLAEMLESNERGSP